MLWNSLIFRGLVLFSSCSFPTFFSSWDNRPGFTGLDSFNLLLDVSSCCSREPSDPLDEWTCRTNSLATDSATVSSQVLSKEDVLLNSGAEPWGAFVFMFCNFDACTRFQMKMIKSGTAGTERFAKRYKYMHTLIFLKFYPHTCQEWQLMG